MKRILILMIAILLTSACSIKLDQVGNNVNINTSKEKENTVVPLEEPDSYIDENPVEISLYVEDNNIEGKLNKADSEIHLPWIQKKDIVVFGSLFSTDDSQESDYFQNVWANCSSKYPNPENYRVGWEVSFNLVNGDTIKQVVHKPSDVQYFYDYLEIYLYDSANVPIGTWYSHLLDNEMNENTIMTSMKLTAGSNFEDIDGPINVAVFTYDTEDDFNDDGTYRGKSYYKVTIYKD